MKMPSSSRRGVLKLLGMAPAAPLAVKAQVDAEIASLVGVRANRAPGLPYALHSLGPMSGPGAKQDGGISWEHASDYLKAFGTPDMVKEVLFRQSQCVYELDPDIAAKRSWSMSVKMLTQRQRNYERALEAYHFNGRLSRMRKIFRQMTGWDWPL